MKVANVEFKFKQNQFTFSELSFIHIRNQSKLVFLTLIQFLTISLLLTVPSGYFHVFYKRVAMTFALQGIFYHDQQIARTYLQNLVQQKIAAGLDQEQFVDAFIGWINANMKLNERTVNHPNPVYLIEHGGICGQFATATVKILRANGYEARQILLNWDGKGTAHVIVEVKIKDQWTAFDPLGFGGGAHSQEKFISHLSDGENRLSALELYHRPDLLPRDNTYNLNFFAQGKAVKVEVTSDYTDFSIQPDYLYGRDWPTVRTNEHEAISWVYRSVPTTDFQDIEFWSVLPYFSRVTLWIGTTPLVLHFEYPILLLMFTAFLLMKYRKMLSRSWRIRALIYLPLCFILYLTSITVFWISRYSL